MKGSHFYADASIAELYAWFAEEAAGSSPTWQRLCEWIATDPAAEPLRERLDKLPGTKRQPNLFLGGLRFLDAPTDPGGALLDWVGEHWPALEQVILTCATQTNEPGRCATLLPAFADLSGPLALIEIGMSAGLCLVPDRYAYRWLLPDGGVHTLGDGAPELTCRIDTGQQRESKPPLPETMPEIVWRAGIDLNPLDPADAEDARWLRALVWPDQPEREQRLATALDTAAGVPVTRVRGDLLAELPGLVERAPAGATVVVFGSAVLAYLQREDRQRYLDLVEGLGVQWIANEGERVVPGVGERAPAWDGPPSFVLSRDGVPLARTGPHGQYLSWL
ncbi:hypothetical protein B0O41_1123 [Propionibacteriaceae bacterium ES.041]|nr:hypothetical protein B0O41_1123 [Propionibacteriaceae bacterium ES.041]